MRFAEAHNLAFIETSALDSTGVETAFHRILTGARASLVAGGRSGCRCSCASHVVPIAATLLLCAEIYRLITDRKSKMEKGGEDGGPRVGAGDPIVVKAGGDSDTKKTTCC